MNNTKYANTMRENDVTLPSQSNAQDREAAANLYKEGRILADKGDWPSAFAKFQASIDLYNGSPHAYMELGRSHLYFHRYEEALQAYCHAQRLRPNYAPIHNGIANVYVAMGKLDEAMAESQVALRLDPDNVIARVGIAFVMVAEKRPEDALPLVQEAVSLDPNDIQANFQLGTVLLRIEQKKQPVQRRNYRNAKEAFHKMLSLDIENVKALNKFAMNHLAVMLEHEGRAVEAEEMYLKCLELEPRWRSGNFNLAMLYLGQGKLILALKHLTRAIFGKPGW